MEANIPCGFQLPHPLHATGHRGLRAGRHQASCSSHTTTHHTHHHVAQPSHHHSSTKLLPLSKSLKFLPLSTTSVLALLVLVLASITAASAQDTCTNSAGCYPPIGNLALGRTVLVNSTCTPNALFCPLFLSTDCALCSAETNSGSSLNDNSNSTFWVSEIGVRQVTLQLDFEAPVFFQDMTMVWQAIRPVAMTLERSCDYGETWSVYRYYAVDCALSFMMEDTFVGFGVGPFSGTTPICTSSQSELFSFDFSDALITFSTSEHTPLNEQEASCYQTITNIRAVMLDFFPEVRISNSSFHYYGVREWIVRGSCMCNGHADTCVPGPGEEVMGGVDRVYSGCMCEHNTASPNCGECLSGFNNAPFRQGTSEEANVCEACMCNEHATDCQYNSSLSASICLNCTNNTAGSQCDECVSGFYQDQGLLLNNPNICIDCDCFPVGIADEEGGCDSQGQCSCKPNVASLRCDQCQNGYFNFSASNPSGCQLCDCNLSGSQLNEQGLPRCDGETGECICRDTVDGDQCDLCRPGSFDLSDGCRSCNCNIGGSTSPVCDQSSPSGQCPCKPNIMGTLCTTPTPGYFFLTLDAFIFEAEEIATILPETEVVLPVDGRYGAFTGRGFVSLPADVSITFLFSPPRDSQYEVILRFSSVTTATYPLSFTLTTLSPVSPSLNCTSTPPMLDTLTYSSTISSALPTPGFLTVDSVCLARSVVYQLSLSYPSTPTSPPLLVDSLVLLPDVAITSDFYMTSDPSLRLLIDTCIPRSAASDVVNRFECEEISFTLMTEFLGEEPLLACDCDPDGSLEGNSSMCVSFGGGCGPCHPGVTGQQCDRCINGFFGFSSGGCEACDCDPIGSLAPTCSSAGQCSCKPGVGGPTCGDCLPDYYNFTAEGCTPCECSQFSSSVSCNVTTGQCLCPEGVTGRTCDTCLMEFFNLSSDGCQSCDCDVSGSVNGVCDPVSGQCPCTRNLGGRQCNECEEGFFNTGDIGGETCLRCVCSGRSSDCSQSSIEAQLQAIHFNFMQLCSSDPIGCGDGWRVLATDNTAETFFGPNDKNGLGYILSINMMPMVFVATPFLGDRRSSYGLNFTAQVTVVSTAELITDNIIVRLQSSQTNASLIAYPYLEFSSNGLEDSVFIALTISLIESNWFYEGSGPTNPDLLEFLLFLADITEISFTADYTVDFIEFVYIRTVSMLYLSSPSSSLASNTSNSFSLPTTYPVEQCVCPAPYQGLSCEICARGFARPSESIGDDCIRCECNGQTLDCDPTTAVCLNCSGNTTGNQCERCEDGFFGDPINEVPCLPCPCPFETKSFSPTCFLDLEDGLPMCDDCAEGYMGRNCEICMDGFFGNPMIDCGRCTTCECNGNVDPAYGPVCNMTTGECMKCLNNTTGFECEICAPGYFGDPGTDIPCQVCLCDPRGLDLDCDPLFGSCYCLPNVDGELCDRCSPGFFNITAGVGCSECNCNPMRAVDANCDQESGNCSCLANVGSPWDNKCQNCTPGFFNFVPGVGCEACGCSELSQSSDYNVSECDAVTGQCQCQEGAIGLKCDECAFGFTGRVPNCERCHDCYLQWFYIIGNFTTQVDRLQDDIDRLITTYYNGHTEESLVGEIARLWEQLDQVNQTLDSITLGEEDVEILEMVLMQMNSTLLMFINRINGIEGDLDEVEHILEQLEQYDGTVNMTSVQDLETRLRELNTTVAALSTAANQSLAQIIRDQSAIHAAWNDILILNSEVEALFLNFTEGESRIESITSLLDAINTTHVVLRRNLTNLDMRANRIAMQLAGATQRAENLTMDVESANDSLILLTEEVERRRAEVMVLNSLIQTLNESVLSLGMVAGDAEMQAEDLMVLAQRTLSLANNTLQNITDTLAATEAIFADMAEALRIAEEVRSFDLPSEEDARMLADRIVRNIVPDELVAGIMQDVYASRETAEQALELASNASTAVSATLALVMQLEEDINCTNTTQLEVEELQSVISTLLAQAEMDIDQVTALFSELEGTCNSSLALYNATLEQIAESSSLGVVSREEARQLLARAQQQAALARQYRDDARTAESDLNQLIATAEEAAANASAALAEAQSLNSEAQMLENNATSISFEDINSLLNDYQEEARSATELQQRIDSLTQEMEQLIELFTATQRRLQQCYRTP